ncbi:hypothetical protein [Streptomyces sp. NPDC002067]
MPLSSPPPGPGVRLGATPDRATRLRLLTDTYGRGISPTELLDLAVVRLSAIAANIEQQIRAGNPAFDVHRDERHPEGYREDIQFILANRDALLLID